MNIDTVKNNIRLTTAQVVKQPPSPSQPIITNVDNSLVNTNNKEKIKDYVDILNKEKDTLSIEAKGKKRFEKLVSDINAKLSGSNKELRYSVHKKTNSIIVKVIDKNTEEVLRELPKEKSLDFLADILEFTGILIDEKR